MVTAALVALAFPAASGAAPPGHTFAAAGVTNGGADLPSGPSCAYILGNAEVAGRVFGTGLILFELTSAFPCAPPALTCSGWSTGAGSYVGWCTPGFWVTFTITNMACSGALLTFDLEVVGDYTPLYTWFYLQGSFVGASSGCP